jgi:hypothetical protein
MPIRAQMFFKARELKFELKSRRDRIGRDLRAAAYSDDHEKGTCDRINAAGCGRPRVVRKQLQVFQQFGNPIARPYTNILFCPMPVVDVGAVSALLRCSMHICARNR